VELIRFPLPAVRRHPLDALGDTRYAGVRHVRALEVLARTNYP
jgi:hypothetical protein